MNVINFPKIFGEYRGGGAGGTCRNKILQLYIIICYQAFQISTPVFQYVDMCIVIQNSQKSSSVLSSSLRSCYMVRGDEIWGDQVTNSIPRYGRGDSVKLTQNDLLVYKSIIKP